MKRILLLTLLCCSAPVLATSGGDIGTLAIGTYACELPGDAAGPVGRRVAAEDFTVVSASSYRSRGAEGSYLLTGDRVVMTSGPLRGQRYRRASDRRLQAMNRDGTDKPLRCIRGTGSR